MELNLAKLSRNSYVSQKCSILLCVLHTLYFPQGFCEIIHCIHYDQRLPKIYTCKNCWSATI